MPPSLFVFLKIPSYIATCIKLMSIDNKVKVGQKILSSLRWLSLDSLVQHCAVLSIMCDHYVDCDCIVFNPPLQIGTSHLRYSNSIIILLLLCFSLYKTNFGHAAIL